MNKEIEIPEGYEARIEGNKVILEPKESENIRKAIERIIREYGRTKCEWLAGYDMDTLVVRLRDAFASLERQKEQKSTYNLEIPAGDVAPAEEDGPFDEDEFLEGELSAFLQNYDKEYEDDAAVSDVANHFYELGKKMKQKPALRLVGDGLISDPNPHFELEGDHQSTGWKPQPESLEDGCNTTAGCIKDESEYDKGYRAGKAYQLKQTEQYTIGKTFMGLIPCWVNAPSELQPAHKYHGRNVVIMHENNGGFRCCFIDDEKATTVHLPEDTFFVEGWRKKPAEWSEEDKVMLNNIIWSVHMKSIIKPLYEMDDRSRYKKYEDFLKALPERFNLQPNWKPSEEQMRAVFDASERNDKLGFVLRNLYNDLKKL